MKLSYLTACFNNLSLEEKVKFAAEQKFDAIELSCWPVANDRDYSSTDIDVSKFDSKTKEDILKLTGENNIEIASLAYYDNCLHPDTSIRENNVKHLYNVIETAGKLGVKFVGAFAGRNLDLSFEENFTEFEKIFPNIVKYAADRNVNLLIENCSMPGWHREGWGATISYSPELWDRMFEIIPDENFGLNFDPSHLIWLGVDYIKALIDYKERVLYFHAKDTKIFEEKRSYYSIFGKQLDRENEWDYGWWQHKIPGKGSVDWQKIYQTLREIGYDGYVSIEHEDLNYSENDEAIKLGLMKGKAFLDSIFKK
ncbi:putative L-xylulose 5-phosphate 3-epimerase [Sebaldella termitidis]|jgi:sugar phosphate isomerase/epimerase|uniref:Xylose isomerase domain protein TIM barrel n=1 Tax=Sebaldella termitidis (strain ATCC 33386 / NCTC 11300) TaxID=526218 RepID=D1AHW3_SEBTE|nr:sugar phosphate isomerase/epimerase [Sebaldella termitidis]ACZ08347.1 Xylose isomerase domain protein TIM barrel [Sebaldella termitidis ATCC 33386]SUI23657.1 putative L-xylulose 5-phosphate 3-epimerase [Sebaldella termitidis]